MSHAGNILRIEFQVFYCVFWSRVLIHCALRGRKQSRKIPLSCASLVFLRAEDVQTENGRYGQGDVVPSTSLEPNQQNFYGTDIHMLKTPHWRYYWKKTVFCCKDCPHFWWYLFIYLAGNSREKFCFNSTELNIKNASKFIFGCIHLWSKYRMFSIFPFGFIYKVFILSPQWMKTKRLTQPIYKYVLFLSMIASQCCCASLMCWASVTALI